MVHGKGNNNRSLFKKYQLGIEPDTFENKTFLSKCGLRKENGTFVMDLCSEPIFVDSSRPLPESNVDKQFYIETDLALKGTVDGQKIDEFGEKPIQGYVCFDQIGNGNCLNLHRNLLLSSDKEVNSFSEGAFVSSQLPFFIQIGSIPFNDFQQSLSIDKVDLNLFEKIEEESVTFVPVNDIKPININDQLVISFPKALSNNSFYFDKQKIFMIKP